MQTQGIREDVDSWQNAMFLYRSAIKEVCTKLEILNDEFQNIHNYNPIEYIKSRLKTPESIVKKLKRNGHDTTIENMLQYVNDIAGVRVVCSFTSDIYRLAEMIGKQKQFTILSVKDYLKHPKESGYRSYHMLITVPIYTSTEVVQTKVEIQIRTIAMDFWASLEHKLRYKKDIPEDQAHYLEEEMLECANISASLDARMQHVRDVLSGASKDVFL